MGREAVTKPYPVKQKLAAASLGALLEMVFNHNLVHADLHPGNVCE
jgi:predicted unusual protein kinase regulating ubiquinone biosynthesis (AarF/ABC1/UbiB family)